MSCHKTILIFLEFQMMKYYFVLVKWGKNSMPTSTNVGTMPEKTVTVEGVVAKALFNAADRLCVDEQTLQKTIGLSESTLEKVKKSGRMPTDPKKMEIALLFIRLFRSLDAIAGGDPDTVRSWMCAENLALCGRPVDRIQTITGLIDVLGYLDTRRALI